MTLEFRVIDYMDKQGCFLVELQTWGLLTHPRAFLYSLFLGGPKASLC